MWEDKTGRTVKGSCRLRDVFLFHGRNVEILQFLADSFERNLKRASQLKSSASTERLRYWNGSSMSQSSFHLFQCRLKQKGQGGNCTEVQNTCQEEIRNVLSNAIPNLLWTEKYKLLSNTIEIIEQNRFKILDS